MNRSPRRIAPSWRKKLPREKSIQSAAARTTMNRRILGAMLLILAAASMCRAVYCRILIFSLQNWESGLELALHVAAVILLIAGHKSAQNQGAMRSKCCAVSRRELNDIRREGGKKRRQFNEVMADSGFHKLDDFLAAAKQSEQDRQKLADLQARLDGIRAAGPSIGGSIRRNCISR